ncbi:hypothetical protein DB347_04960 [Opitutaceae bacterium EW11]|nr:hypothetical protein DB347_04960 [Opitutaceae bacterium EW11]
MKSLRILHLLPALAFAAGAASLHAQTAGQVATGVDSISIISITGSAPTVTMSSSNTDAGKLPGNTGATVGVSNAEGTAPVLRITNNVTPDRKITARLSAGTEVTGSQLTVKLGTHSGSNTFVDNTVTLTSTDQDFITGIGAMGSDTLDPTGLPLIYTFRSNAAVPAPTAAVTLTVTYTITAGS